VEWKKVADSVKHEHESKGFAGRYGAGLPRINDGSFLFLQHMISKMRPPEQGGSRLAIVFNGSPLFTGAAGSGESEIRRWIIENDWLEAVVALPDQLFYNTGISTYFWIVTNRKSPNRKGKVQLIDARQSFTKMRKSLGEKRKEISADQIADIVRLYGNFDQQLTDDDERRVKIFPNEAFGFLRITVERPLRLKWEVTDASADALLADKKLAKLDEQQRQVLVEHARGRVGTTFDSEAAARKEAKRWMADLHLDGKPIESAIVDALAQRDPDADPITDKHGHPEPDPDLRDNENVPLPNEPVRYEPDPTDRLATDTYVKAAEQYVEQEVHPYVPDAWIDHTKTKIGYEIPLTRHFYVYTPPRALEEIDAEIKQLEAEIQELLRKVTQ
jgi:type I restriction enzyme M protein